MLERVLGPDCEGSIRSDYHGVYISYVKSNEKAWHQACLAHLKREFTRCTKNVLDRDMSQYGEKTLKLLEEFFKAQDKFNEDKTPEALDRFRRAAEDFNRKGALDSDKGQSARLAKRFACGDGVHRLCLRTGGRYEQLLGKGDSQG